MPAAPSQTLLIRNATPVLRDGVGVATPIDVMIEDGVIRRIEPVGGALASARADRVVLATDRFILPGFVNAHYHSYDTLHKGRFEDLPFDLWALMAQPGPWGPRSSEELRLRTLVGAMEAIASGITTVQDMHSVVPQTQSTLDTILDAYDEIGIRCVFSVAARDLPALDSAAWLPEDCPPSLMALAKPVPLDPAEEIAFIADQLDGRHAHRPRLTWAITPSGPQRCSPTMLRGLADMADRAGLPVLTHAYETLAQLGRARSYRADGCGSLLDRLDDAGLLNHTLTLAHGVYLDDADIDRLAQVGAGVVCNPLANLKLKNGVAPIARFQAAGVRLALGCDNCSCSDCQDMFQAMKATTLLAQASDPMPTGFTARDALVAATQGGAAALGLDGGGAAAHPKVGKIAAGYAADLVLLNRADTAFLPANDVVRQTVFSATVRTVRTVIIAGEVVFDDGLFTRIDAARVRAELAALQPSLDAGFAALQARQAPLFAALLAAQSTVAGLFADDQRTVPGRPIRRSTDKSG